MNEAQLVTKILGALNGVPETFAFKVVAAPYARKGISDIIGCHRGSFFAFEVKLPGKEKTLTIPQENFLAAVLAVGGTAHTVTSVEQALTDLSAITAYERQVSAILNALRYRPTPQTPECDRPIGPHD